MARFNNHLPASADIRYTAIDNMRPLQHVNAHTNIESIKDVRPNTNISVTIGDAMQNILAPLNVNQTTLNIMHGIGNVWFLQWG